MARIGFLASEELSLKNVDDDDGRTTDAYYRLAYVPFGSGELKPKRIAILLHTLNLISSQFTFLFQTIIPLLSPFSSLLYVVETIS